MPAALSVNLNKIALLRNSRGRNVPSLLDYVDRTVAAGAHGITLHPRLDQRHVRFDDVPAVAEHLRAHHPGIELNIECEDDASLIDLVCDVRPDQCTLVPVSPGEVTSDHGWTLPDDTPRLERALRRLLDAGVRTSGFVDCIPDRVAAFASLGMDRVELYTGPYAWAWTPGPRTPETDAVWATAAAAREVGLGLNAGHDLDRTNLAGLCEVPGLAEVSIGHALVGRALEVSFAVAVRELLDALGWDQRQTR
ncbi:MAG: pyridoxine 5'-phosphate synthase [Myxococcota bacterium]